VKAEGEDTNAHELVLIRRRAASEEGGHHGGVWKIAYADFMTAMMAFFLVMWLINSTDQRVLTQVANYFNPMRLTDSTPHSRGLNSIEAGEQGKQGKQSSVGDPKEKNSAKEKAPETTAAKSAATKGDAKDEGGATARYSEQALFSDPYGVLARIAAEAPTDTAPAAAKEDAKAGDSYRDPFDPAAQPVAPDKRTARAKARVLPPPAKDAAAVPPGGEAKTEQDANATPKAVQGPAAEKLAPAAGGEAKTLQEKAATPRELSPPAEKAVEAAVQETLRAAKQAEAEKALRDEATKIERDIKRLASQLQGTVPNINVTVTDDGVLISLTDDYDFGMFSIASAEPRAATVVIMEKIARMLQTYSQPLIVRGHTDGRRYRSGSYDNWRLSTARAHMAYYMLVRGGVDEKRFERVEGYADRNLRVPSDPEAAQNRRIEILLRNPKP
jgi:chemotaxis protein MotB